MNLFGCFPFDAGVFRTFQVLEFSRKKIQDFSGGMGTLSDSLKKNTTAQSTMNI